MNAPSDNSTSVGVSVSEEVEIGLPIEEVRAHFFDIEYHSKHDVHPGYQFIVKSQEADAVTYDQVSSGLFGQQRDLLVTRRDSHHNLRTLCVQGPNLGLTVNFDFEPRSEGRCVCRATFSLPTRGVLRMSRPLVRWGLRRAVRAALQQVRVDLESGRYTHRPHSALGWGAMRFLPLAVLAAAAAWLGSTWDTLPEHWAVHWGSGGMPDGFASKNFGGVFGPLLFAAALAVFLEVLAVVLERISRARFPRLARAYGNFVRWVSLAVMGSISAVAILLPSETPPSPGVFLGLTLGSVALAVVAGAVGLVSATRHMVAQGQSLPKGYTPLIYRNPDDPRLIVPKLVGVGWTFNFARPAAWLLLALLLLSVFGVLVIAFLSAR